MSDTRRNLVALLQKPFGKSQRAIHKSGSTGRRAHSKLEP